MFKQARVPSRATARTWQALLLSMLPAIEAFARRAFRSLSPEAKEDAVAEVVANCTVALARLAARGRLHVAYPVPLATYAVRQYFDGRRVGTKANTRDVLDQHARQRGGYEVQHMGSPREQRNGWKDQLVENRKTTPGDLAAFRVDFGEWLRTRLPRRERRIAEELAMGEQTGVVAKRHGISAGRVSQLRRELFDSWQEFTGEATAEDLSEAA